MSQEQDNSAFPLHMHGDYGKGMTLRDYFAAAASQEDIETMIFQHRKKIEDTQYGPVYENPTRAQCRYLHADAMLAARKERS